MSRVGFRRTALLLAAISAALAGRAVADSDAPWSDGFEGQPLEQYVQGTVPAGASLVKPAGREGHALRLAPKQKSELMLRETAVEPGAKYRLTFAARTQGPDVLGKNPATEKLFFAPDKSEQGLLLPGWEICVLDSKRRLPHAGHLKTFWQYAFADDWHAYRQCFYAPADGRTLQVIFCNPGGENTLWVDDVKLERCDEPNLFLSEATFANRLDYSGWTELSKAAIVEDNGKVVLQVARGGYALSDLIPCRPGEYMLAGRRASATAFFYDADLRRMGSQRSVGTKLTVPANATAVQLFCGAGVVEGLASVAPPPAKNAAPPGGAKAASTKK